MSCRDISDNCHGHLISGRFGKYGLLTMHCTTAWFCPIQSVESQRIVSNFILLHTPYNMSHQRVLRWTYCSPIVHLLPINYPPVVYLLFIYCLHVVHLLSTYCLPIVHLLSTYCLPVVHTLSTDLSRVQITQFSAVYWNCTVE